MNNFKNFVGSTDSDKIEEALRLVDDGIFVLPSRNIVDNERDYWLIDRAILIPENTTIILQNCTIKLSDSCRDNFFRTANCGIGIEFPESIKNVHIKGEGECRLIGADHPRATGDSSKLLHNPCPHYPEDICKYGDWIPEERRKTDLISFCDVHNHSYGSDAGNINESQYGDWRGIGILFANVDNFSISGITLSKTHGWAISLEECSNGCVENIRFDSCMHKEIDGIVMNMENQDGIDIRNGCHHITVQNITGETGDDVIALTAIASPKYRPGGSMRSTHVMHSDWTKRERDIHDIIIRNVIAHSYLCWVVRLLPGNSKIYNVVVDGVIEDSADYNSNEGTVILGCDTGYDSSDTDSINNIILLNIVCNSKTAISVDKNVSDSLITNIINKNPNCNAIRCENQNELKNVIISNILEQ